MSNSTKEPFFIAGDQPDPAGTDLRGVASGFDFTKAAAGHPMLLYRVGGQELILEADVYRLPGQPPYIILLCPACMMAHNGKKNALKIDGQNKHISYDAAAEVPPFKGWTAEQMRASFPNGAGGLLSVEEFACAWELEPELRRHFGFAICPWRVVIENNLVIDV